MRVHGANYSGKNKFGSWCVVNATEDKILAGAVGYSYMRDSYRIFFHKPGRKTYLPLNMAAFHMHMIPGDASGKYLDDLRRELRCRLTAMKSAVAGLVRELET